MSKLRKATKRAIGFIRGTALYRVYSALKHRYFDFKFRERQHGKNPKYMIACRAQDAGLFSYFITVLGVIAEADKRGLIPVVDLKNYNDFYQQLETWERGNVNFWENYFLQPGNVSLDEAYAGEYVLSCKRPQDKYLIPGFSDSESKIYPAFFENRSALRDYWISICSKYIRFTPDIENKLKAAAEKYIYENGKVLGVSIRAGYVLSGYLDTTSQGTIEDYIEKIDEALGKVKFDKIYLAIDYPGYAEKLIERYKDMIILYDREYHDFSKGFDAKEEWNLYGDGTKYFIRRRNEQYLLQMMLLTKCKGLITSITSGSVAVVCFPTDYEYLHVF